MMRLGKIDLCFVLQQIEALRRDYPELEADEEAWELSLASETGLIEALQAIERKRAEAHATATVLASWIKEIDARLGRFEKREKAMRSLTLRLMQHAEVRKVELPEATLSVANGQSRVVITDEQAIPDIFCKIIRQPDKTKIKEHLKSGLVMNGATLSNAEPHLVIRVQ